MDIRKITDKVSVSAQITADDLVDIKAAGFRAIICNRPDGEGADQPGFEEIEAAASKVGLAAAYLPVASSGATDENVADFGAVIKDLPRPLLGYCRSGTRSAILWSLHEAQKRPLSEILAATKAAGYDMNGIAQRVADGGRAPSDKGDAF